MSCTRPKMYSLSELKINECLRGYLSFSLSTDLRKRWTYLWPTVLACQGEFFIIIKSYNSPTA